MTSFVVVVVGLGEGRGVGFLFFVVVGVFLWKICNVNVL